MPATPATSRPDRRPGDPTRLRVTFEVPSVMVAVSLEAQLRAVTDLPSQICTAGRAAPSDRAPADAPGWYVEVQVEPIPGGPAAMHALERRMLSLEYRWVGSRFLGFTTDAIPGLVERFEPQEPRPKPSQRRYVEESLLRCPADKDD